MFYIGLDLSLTNTGCCIIKEDGSLYKSKTFPTKPSLDVFSDEIRIIHIRDGIINFISDCFSHLNPAGELFIAPNYSDGLNQLFAAVRSMKYISVANYIRINKQNNL